MSLLILLVWIFPGLIGVYLDWEKDWTVEDYLVNGFPAIVFGPFWLFLTLKA